jgi:hypothetical protein
MEYIKEARELMDDDQITQTLLAVGWSREMVMRLIERK